MICHDVPSTWVAIFIQSRSHPIFPTIASFTSSSVLFFSLKCAATRCFNCLNWIFPKISAAVWLSKWPNLPLILFFKLYVYSLDSSKLRSWLNSIMSASSCWSIFSIWGVELPVSVKMPNLWLPSLNVNWVGSLASWGTGKGWMTKSSISNVLWLSIIFKSISYLLKWIRF